ncbi:hypothetical protein [Streptomyces sp. NBC_01314]|uniref:hypothetical protein n=1 Tax=Streptomyces sp. NBC_01314 TaxID=2903821 RepID=UPI0030932E90|nr:hypothetical protein OG622_23695 [Streptomyces sp. NBC_01314]
MNRYRAAAVGAVLALAGCSAGGQDGSGGGAEPQVTTTPAMLRTAGVSFPLDAYEATPEQQNTLGRAQGVLTGRCMSRLGFTYRPPEQRIPSTGASNARVFGLVDPDTAARYGYLNPGMANAAEGQGTSRAPDGGQRLTQAERLALNGEDGLDPKDVPATLEEAEKSGGSDVRLNGRRVPVGGCVRESFLQLYARKANEVDFLFVFNLKAEADSKTREDSRVRAVDKSWSTCMAKAGYQVTDPLKAAVQLGFAEAKLSGPDAVTAAKADVRCKERVNFVGVRYAVAGAYQQRLIEENAETLALAKEQLESRLRLAATLT